MGKVTRKTIARFKPRGITSLEMLKETQTLTEFLFRNKSRGKTRFPMETRDEMSNANRDGEDELGIVTLKLHGSR